MRRGKRVVLLAVNSKYIHSSLAVWQLAAGIAKFAQFPHEVSVVEATIHQPYDDIIGLVSAQNPEIIGISTYIWNARMLPELLKLLIERLPEAVIALGGPEASHNADYWLQLGADHVLAGEGEYVFPTFLDRTQGIASLDSAKAVNTTEPPPYVTCTANDAYLTSLSGRIAYLETSRGCPFSCAYCLSAGSGVKLFPIEEAKEQLRILSQTEAKTIKLVDRTFNCNAKRTYDIFEHIIGLDTTCSFHFEVAADLFDEHTLTLLALAPPGRIQLEVGLQSFFRPALNAVARKTDLEKAEQNILKLLQVGNIHIHIDLIAGLPYETLDDFQKSFERAYSLRAHTLQLGFLKLLHGSVLRLQAESMGIRYAAEAPYEIQSSPWITPQDIRILKQTENALQNTQNKGRFLSTLEYVLSTSKLRPFAFFQELGQAAPHNGTALPEYATQVFDFCATLPMVDINELRDRMICDWLAMVKGKNMPAILRIPDSKHREMFELAKQRLGHEVRREEVRVLSAGNAAFVDSNDRDLVTGLYRVYH